MYSKSQQSKYWRAVCSGDLESLKALLAEHKEKNDSFNLNSLNDYELPQGEIWGLLHKAAFFGYTAIVELLLDHGADVALFSEADVRDCDFG